MKNKVIFYKNGEISYATNGTCPGGRATNLWSRIDPSDLLDWDAKSLERLAEIRKIVEARQPKVTLYATFRTTSGHWLGGYGALERIKDMLRDLGAHFKGTPITTRDEAVAVLKVDGVKFFENMLAAQDYLDQTVSADERIGWGAHRVTDIDVVQACTGSRP
jgi:hypothetical protein